MKPRPSRNEESTLSIGLRAKTGRAVAVVLGLVAALTLVRRPVAGGADASGAGVRASA